MSKKQETHRSDMNRRIPLFQLALWFAMGLLLWHTMISCTEDTAWENTPIPGSFESTAIAGVEQQVVYIAEGDPFSIEVISIRDSRCPSDVVCVWAGVAQVTFSITGIGHPIDLYFGMGSDPETSSYAFVFGGRSYELTLEDVTPYPTRKNTDSIRKAHFNVHSR